MTPHPSITAAMERISSALHKQEIDFECDLECDDGDCAYQYIARDGDTARVGMILFSPKLQGPAFLGFDHGRQQRDEAEGINPDESKSLFSLETERLFVLWLNGTFARVWGEVVRERTAQF